MSIHVTRDGYTQLSPVWLRSTTPLTQALFVGKEIMQYLYHPS